MGVMGKRAGCGWSLSEARCDATFAEKARRTGLAGVGLGASGAAGRAGSWVNFVRDASTVLHSDDAGCLGLESSIVLLVCRRKMSLSN